jgi:hypothetical protein
MTTDNDFISMTIRIPKNTHQTLVNYKNRFKPHMSLNSLIVESILDEVTAHESGQARELAETLGGLK